MGGLCRKYLYKIFNSTLCSNPFMLGLLAGILINLSANNTTEEVGLEEVDNANADNSLLDRLETNINIMKEVDQDSYVRPRFIRDEINISYPLFVGILMVDGTPDSFFKYYNLTTQHYCEKSVVFTTRNASNDDIPSAVVLKAGGGFRQMLEHIGEHHSDYSFYFLLHSDTLINGLQLVELVKKFHFEKDVLLGVGSGDSCDTRKGLFVNNKALKRLLNLSENGNSFGCDNGETTKSYTPIDFNILASTTLPRDTLTIHSIIRSEQGYRQAALRLLQAQRQMLQAQLADAEEDIESFSDESDYLDSDWPVLVYKPEVGVTRFDNEIHEFIDNRENSEQIAKSSSSFTRQPSPTETVILNKMADKCMPNQQSRVVSGWKKVDFNSGVKYILNLEYLDDEDKLVRSDCTVFQEFADPILVSLPFVTESTKISLVIPVAETDRKDVLNFLKSFAKTCLERNDRVFLMFVFLYTRDRPDKNNNKDFYKEVKQTALQLSKKFKKKDKGSSILWYSMQLKEVEPTPLETMDLLTHKLDSKSIILMGSPNMELHSDYLNRVRMNTIEGRLAFSPIPYTEYHPQIASRNPSSSMSFDLNNGKFDSHDYQHFSFFKSDYLALREYIDIPLLTREDDLFNKTELKSYPTEVFRISTLFQKFGHLRNHNDEDTQGQQGGKLLHVIRAAEPSLRLCYRSINCYQHLPKQVYSECLERRQMSLGSRAQLAKLFLNQNL